jgi:hypothetical protein
MRFPIQRMKLSDAYGPVSVWPKDLLVLVPPSGAVTVQAAA